MVRQLLPRSRIIHDPPSYALEFTSSYTENEEKRTEGKPNMPKNRIESLREKKAQLEEQIKNLEARERQQERKNDTRRKVIAGALALEHMSKNPTSDFAHQ
jgi:hypothetical protein